MHIMLLVSSRRISSSPLQFAEDSAIAFSQIGHISSLVEAAWWVLGGHIDIACPQWRIDGNISLLKREYSTGRLIMTIVDEW